MARRCFLAFDLPTHIHHHLRTVMVTLRERLGAQSIRWVQPEQVHLTLHFLGAAVPAQKITQLLGPGLELVGQYAPMQLATAGVGSFPPRRPARIIFMECAGAGIATVSQLQRQLGHLIQTCGMAVDPRPWQPHLTLGRCQRPLTTRLPDLTLAPCQFTVNALLLYESQLRPAGPQYRPLAAFPLGAP